MSANYHCLYGYFRILWFFKNIFSFTPLVTNKWPFRLQHGLQNTTLNTTFATEYLCIKANLFTFMTLYFVTPDKIYSCYF